MDVDAVFTQVRSELLDEAYTQLERSHASHYEAAGEAFTRERIAALFDLVVAAIADRDLAEIGGFAEDVAEQRFASGFDVSEVQAAFNALEQAMWRRVVTVVPADGLADAVGLLSTVLGYGKDALARRYVSLASKRHVPSLDLTALFAGTNS